MGEQTRASDTLGHAPADEAAIRAAQDILAIHLETHGVGAKEARADYFGGSTLVVFLEGLDLLPNEEYLLAEGEGEAVMNARTRYQEAVKGRFIDAVERATGRHVDTFSSVTNLEGNRFAAEIFTLGTAP